MCAESRVSRDGTRADSRIVGALLLGLLVGFPTPGSSGSTGAFSGPGRYAFERWLNGSVRLLLTDQEARIADALSEAPYFSAFERWFWMRRDPSPGTLVNEFRDQFNARVENANEEFGAKTDHAGWDTGRGVVYILLGPPARVSFSTVRSYGGELYPVEIWSYKLEDAPDLSIPFVQTAEGFVLLTGDDRRSRADLDRVLEQVTEGAVRNRDLRFTDESLRADANSTPSLPALGALRRRAGGIDGQFSVPLTELYGQPENDGLRIELRFEAGGPGTGGAVSLGRISVLLSREEFERGSDHTLRVAFWLPADGGLDLPAKITITEVISGRTARLVSGPEPQGVAEAYPVGELLGRVDLANGTGAAFAFIENNAVTVATPNTMWLVRPPYSLDAEVLEKPVDGLWLVRTR